MRKEIIVCDRCKQDDPAPASGYMQHLQAFVDRKADAAGGMESEFYNVDLCPPCLARVVVVLLAMVANNTTGEPGEILKAAVEK